MLRESVENLGESVDLDGLADPSRTELKGVPNSHELLQFANTFIGDDTAAFSAARIALAEKMGAEAMVDAAGIASNFQRMVRIADATGIPTEAPMLVMSEDLCAQLGIDQFGSAANSKKPSFFQKLILKFIAVRQFRKMVRNYGKDK